MSLTNDERKAIVDYRLEKADLAFNESKKVAAISLWNISANRLYYALYYAVSALWIHDGYSSHTHSGLIAQFSLYYVKTGVFSTDDARLLRSMFNLRHEGDYEDFVDVAEEDIAQATPLVQALIGKIKNKIQL